MMHAAARTSPGALLAAAILIAATIPPLRAQETDGDRGEREAPPITLAAPGRLELGRLVQELERTWLATPDPDARARAVPRVVAAISSWFRADFENVVRGLVDGEALLRRPEGAAPDDLWRGALVVAPVDRTPEPGDPLRLSVGPAFPVEAHRPPDGAAIRIVVAGTEAAFRPPFDLPLEVPLPDGAVGDLPVTIRVIAGGRERTLPEWITVTEGLDARLAALRDRLRGAPPSIERETARAMETRLRALSIGLPVEVPFPAAADLERAERIAEHAVTGEHDPSLAAPGDRWIRLPLPDGSAPCRLRVPAAVSEGARPLLVIAHGMGGSEHMFFEAHGDGLAVRLAEERGWIVAAPYFGIAMGGPEVGDIVTALEAFLPVDRERILLLGHSMGAMRIVSAAAAEPTRYRALAPLSGGAGLPPGTAFDGLPFFLAAGDQDFGKGMTLTLENALRAAGAEVTKEIYAPSEHLLMVVDSLPDVFAFFDTHANSDPKSEGISDPERERAPRDR